MLFRQKMKVRFFTGDSGDSEKQQANPAPQVKQDKRKRILQDLEAFLLDGKPVSEIRDESELPYPKALLHTAITAEMLYEKDDKRVEYLKYTAACLADFQNDVGPEPVTLLGISDTEMLSADLRELVDTQDPIERIKKNPHGEKYRALRTAAELELENTLRKLTAVARLRRKAPGDGWTGVLGDSGVHA